MDTQVSYAEASTRVATLQAQLAAIDAELAGARKRRDDHEVAAVISDTEVDPSLHAAVVVLSDKHSRTTHLLSLVSERAQTLRQQEEERELAAKRAAAEKKVEALLQVRFEKVKAGIEAVFVCASLFREMGELTTQVKAVLAKDLPGDKRNIRPLPGGGRINFFDEQSVNDFAADCCAFGYASFVPDSSTGKKQFNNRNR